MTYKDISNACNGITQANIKKDENIFPIEQIKAFRKLCPHGQIIVSCENDASLAQIVVDGVMLASSTKIGRGLANELAAISNALLYCGFGVNARLKNLKDKKDKADDSE